MEYRSSLYNLLVKGVRIANPVKKITPKIKVVTGITSNEYR